MYAPLAHQSSESEHPHLCASPAKTADVSSPPRLGGKKKLEKVATNRALVLPDLGLVPLSLGVVSDMEPPTSTASLDDLPVLSLPYPGSPRGGFPCSEHSPYHLSLIHI